MKKKYIVLILFILVILCITQFSGNSEKTALTLQEIPSDFQFDGCSMFPDGNYLDCCTQHDISYFWGGTWKQRIIADNELSVCVAQKGGFHKALGPTMWLGVRVGGAPIWPTSFRWGFGRDRY